MAAPTARLRVGPEDEVAADRQVPVARPYMPTAAALLPYLERIDASRWYSNFGPLNTEFEARLAARFGPDAAAVTVANGTVGLVLALKALGPLAGRRCLMPAWTFVATAHAAIEAGLEPWFADVDPSSMALSPDIARQMLADASEPVGAVIVTAPFGRPIDVDSWLRFRDETGLPVLIDAAAAFDAQTDARLPVMISLHATKTLGIGEGGVVVTDDRALAARIRELSTFGFHGSRESRIPATNAKLSEYAAAVGLAALDAWPATRLRYLLAGRRLRIALTHTPEVEFQPGWGVDWASSVCVVRLPEGSSDRIEARLRQDRIDTRRWWSKGCQSSPAFADLPRADLTETLVLADRVLGIPYAADMEIEDIERVAAALTSAVAAE